MLGLGEGCKSNAWEMVSPYNSENYHLNENKPGKYFQRFGKWKIRKMQVGAQSSVLGKGRKMVPVMFEANHFSGAQSQEEAR